MCNIAGYIGTRQAAPILMKQEAFNGGYFTGIATLHEGKIHYAKLTGDTHRLMELTDAASLPGTIGIIHSRSNADGGDEWAHPFIGYRNDEAALAYVANGHMGYFESRAGEYNVLTEKLLNAGYRMTRRKDSDGKPYQTLSDGSLVHMSDAMCQLILRNMDSGAETADAMADAFCEMPAEIVGLAIDAEKPDCIHWSRINMPMSISFADHVRIWHPRRWRFRRML